MNEIKITKKRWKIREYIVRITFSSSSSFFFLRVLNKNVRDVRSYTYIEKVAEDNDFRIGTIYHLIYNIYKCKWL